LPSYTLFFLKKARVSAVIAATTLQIDQVGNKEKTLITMFLYLGLFAVLSVYVSAFQQSSFQENLFKCSRSFRHRCDRVRPASQQKLSMIAANGHPRPLQQPFAQVVLLRHGESTWNEQNIFTGWKDVGLTDRGIQEARDVGKVMNKHGLEFDMVYTSLLKRAIKTSALTLDTMDQSFVEVRKDWRLNEQMYGALEGRNKKACVKEHGYEQVQKWRRGYHTAPPPNKKQNGYFPDDPQYAQFTDLDAPDSWCGSPGTESLKDTQARVWSLWRKEIMPNIKSGKRVLVCCHGNVLRALMKRLDNISIETIQSIDIPRAMPIVYTLDKDMNPIMTAKSSFPISGRFLADKSQLHEALARERDQVMVEEDFSPQVPI